MWSVRDAGDEWGHRIAAIIQARMNGIPRCLRWRGHRGDHKSWMYDWPNDYDRRENEVVVSERFRAIFDVEVPI